jgi:hypothetical protein
MPTRVCAEVPSLLQAVKPGLLTKVTVKRGPVSKVEAVAVHWARVEARARAVARKE